MRLEDGELLPYLHDAVLLDLHYDARSPDTRTLVVTVQCNPDTGYEPWNDATLNLCAKGVFLFRCTAWGFCFGQDTIDTWHEGVSNRTASELRRLEAQGPRLPSWLFTVALHSGSCIELVCDSLEVKEGVPRVPGT
jgi:hypothetical protein